MEQKHKPGEIMALRPFRRRLIQLYCALLYNANLKGFAEGKIWTGRSKALCVPGLNCYSCPGAVASCPLGALQNAVASSGTRTGTYVFGKLLGEGEVPLRLGAANYYTSALMASGGKLLLTDSALYFSSHAFNAGKTDLSIPLEDITEMKHDRNQIISDQISVYVGTKRHRFVVFGGKEWLELIVSAKENLPARAKSAAAVKGQPAAGSAEGDYAEELLKLKKLLDAGVLTEEEFTIKKRMILGL